MIRHDVDLNRLETLVDEHKPGWRARAEERTERFRALGAYGESSSIWGEIKAVFLELQEAKCCFCERKFGGGFSQYELDVEHFRPKGRVRQWPCPQDLAAEFRSPTAAPAGNGGYYLLSYQILNYAAACKPCNSGLKKNYFPISGEYDFAGTVPNAMKAERPWLMFPIGSTDVDPEDVVTFYGMLPQCKSDDPELKLRGHATIAFFGLDDVIARKDLMRERANVIFVLQVLLERERAGHPRAAAMVSRMVDSSAPHANCARSFKNLFDRNRTEAASVAELAERFIESGS